MKHTLKLTAAILGLSVVSASAYDVSVRNFTGATTGLPILDNAGNVLAMGIVAVGTFPVGFDFNQPAANIIAGFQQFNGDLMQPPLGAFPGLFNNTLIDSIPESSVLLDAGFFGDTIYTIVGDATTVLADSSFIAVLSEGSVFGKEDMFGMGAISVDYVNGSDIVYGDLIPGPISAGPFTFGVGAKQVDIPEPSASLLAGLAGLALLIRRRR